MNVLFIKRFLLSYFLFNECLLYIVFGPTIFSTGAMLLSQINGLLLFLHSDVEATAMKLKIVSDFEAEDYCYDQELMFNTPSTSAV